MHRWKKNEIVIELLTHFNSPSSIYVLVWVVIVHLAFVDLTKQFLWGYLLSEDNFVYWIELESWCRSELVVEADVSNPVRKYLWFINMSHICKTRNHLASCNFWHHITLSKPSRAFFIIITRESQQTRVYVHIIVVAIGISRCARVHQEALYACEKEDNIQYIAVMYRLLKCFATLIGVSNSGLKSRKKGLQSVFSVLIYTKTKHNRR